MENNKVQVIGLGVATIDIILCIKKMPTWKSNSIINKIKICGGGMVGTAMATVSRLGVKPGYIGTIGNDEFGELKLKSLIKEKIDISRIVRREKEENQIVIVYVDEKTGERVFSFTNRINTYSLKVKELDYDYITGANFLHLDGFHFKAAIQAAKWMQLKRKKVVLDAVKTNKKVLLELQTLMRYVDILICSSGFISTFTGKSDIIKGAKNIFKLGPKLIIQTEGSNGCYTITKDEYFHTPGFKVSVIDTTGAGDVFHGAYLVGLCHQWNLKKIAVFSNAVAALKCTKIGGRDGIPTFEETLSFLKNLKIDFKNIC